ncbi:aldo keto reductase [Aureococcus anophagefferens]|nr:aldo keto reductase [Aureococcus anophagefferens]
MKRLALLLLASAGATLHRVDPQQTSHQFLENLATAPRRDHVPHGHTGHTGRARAARDAAAARHMAKIEAVYSANVSAKSVYGERADLYERGHGGEQKAKRLENPKVRAQCSRVPVTEDVRKLRAQNRASPSSRASTSSRNDDGTCADCARVRRVPCGDVLSKPAGLFVVIGGGDDRQLQFHCVGSYCGYPHAPVVATTGAHPPHDYVGGCAVAAFTKARVPFLHGPHISATADPPTRVAWFPILNPHTEVRGIWERSLLYAGLGDVPADYAGPPVPPPLRLESGDDVGVPTKKAMKDHERRRGMRVDADVEFQRDVVEGSFLRSGFTRIEVLRDDALPKPLLLPPRERLLFDELGSREALRRPRAKRLLYIGSFRANKGQRSFLSKLDADSLGDYDLEFYGLRQEGQEAEYDAVAALVADPKFRGKVTIHDARVSHEDMMRAMATASGLVHYSNQDRNPRVLYEALYFGLPVLVATQAMPYVGLQCKPFVTLTDADGDAAVLNADVAAFVAALAESAGRAAAIGDPSAELTSRNDEPVQVAIRVYVEQELLTMKVYEQLCARLGLCDRRARAPTPWAKGKGRQKNPAASSQCRVANDAEDDDDCSDRHDRGPFAPHEAWHLGITSFDCAAVYGGGRCEEILGAWLRDAAPAAARAGAVVVTKGGCGAPDTSWAPRLAYRDLRAELDASLAKLGRVDLYLLHRDDPSRPVAEIVRSMNELLASGDGPRAWGDSLAAPRHAPWPGTEYMTDADRAWYASHPDVPVLAWEVLAKGFLAGRWDRGDAPRGDAPPDAFRAGGDMGVARRGSGRPTSRTTTSTAATAPRPSARPGGSGRSTSPSPV